MDKSYLVALILAILIVPAFAGPDQDPVVCANLNECQAQRLNKVGPQVDSGSGGGKSNDGGLSRQNPNSNGPFNDDYEYDYYGEDEKGGEDENQNEDDHEDETEKSDKSQEEDNDNVVPPDDNGKSDEPDYGDHERDSLDGDGAVNATEGLSLNDKSLPGAISKNILDDKPGNKSVVDHILDLPFRVNANGTIEYFGIFLEGYNATYDIADDYGHPGLNRRGEYVSPSSDKSIPYVGEKSDVDADKPNEFGEAFTAWFLSVPINIWLIVFACSVAIGALLLLCLIAASRHWCSRFLSACGACCSRSKCCSRSTRAAEDVENAVDVPGAVGTGEVRNSPPPPPPMPTNNPFASAPPLPEINPFVPPRDHHVSVSEASIELGRIPSASGAGGPQFCLPFVSGTTNTVLKRQTPVQAHSAGFTPIRPVRRPASGVSVATLDRHQLRPGKSDVRRQFVTAHAEAAVHRAEAQSYEELARSLAARFHVATPTDIEVVRGDQDEAIYENMHHAPLSAEVASAPPLEVEGQVSIAEGVQASEDSDCVLPQPHENSSE